jgi:DNA repair and recombination protein RAD54B
MKKDFIAFCEQGAAVAELAMTKALRLQQICSGFMKLDGEEQEVSFKTNPRAEVLSQVLENILECSTSKVCIWSVFKQNYKDIAAVCDKLGVKYVSLHGDTPQAKRQENIDAFHNDPDIRVFVGNPQSGGIGISLTMANYAIFYSRNFSLENDIQAAARNYRGGSEMHSKITRIDLVSRDTIDELVLSRLSLKMAITDKVLRSMSYEL